MGRRNWVLAAISALLAAVFIAGLLNWRSHADGLNYSGWHQGDFPTYLCYARQASVDSAFLAYSQPHDLRPDPPSRFVNLGVSILAIVLRLGVPVEWAEHLFRFVGGFAMFFSLGWAIRPLFPNPRAQVFAVILSGAGGGAFALAAWLNEPSQLDIARLAEESRRLQETTYWWFLSVYRNLLYPLETLYHAIIFWMLGLMVRRRLVAAAGVIAVAFLANPFAGIQATAAFSGGFLLLFTSLAERERRRAGVVAIVTVGLFAAYYGVYLPLDAVAASVSNQHRAAFPEPLGLDSALLAYGVAALPIGLLAITPRSRRREWGLLAPFMSLAATSLLLSQHSRFLPSELVLQPMHFTRGYTYFGVAVVGAFALSERLQSHRRWLRYAAACVLLVAACFDTLLFVYDQTFLMRPNVASLRWDEPQRDVLNFLRRSGDGAHVTAPDWQISRVICAQADQRSAFGTNFTTPFYQRRWAELQDLLSCGAGGSLGEWTEYLVLQKHRMTVRLRRCEQWDSVYENDVWIVFRRHV